MSYSDSLAKHIRDKFSTLPQCGGKGNDRRLLTFMCNHKMCVGIFRGQLMCRISPDVYEAALEKQGCHAMEFGGRVMKGYVLVDETGIQHQEDFEYWIRLALEFDSKAKATNRRSK